MSYIVYTCDKKNYTKKKEVKTQCFLAESSTDIRVFTFQGLRWVHNIYKLYNKSEQRQKKKCVCENGSFHPMRSNLQTKPEQKCEQRMLIYRDEVSLGVTCRPLLTWKRVSSDIPYCSNGSCEDKMSKISKQTSQWPKNTSFIYPPTILTGLSLPESNFESLTLPVSLWISVL